jgi:hypothetical protein
MTPIRYSPLRQLAFSRRIAHSHLTQGVTLTAELPRLPNVTGLVLYAAIRSFATIYATRCLTPISQDFPLLSLT